MNSDTFLVPLRIMVIGAGSFGSALASVLAQNGHNVTLYGRDADRMERIRTTHANERYLPGVRLHEGIMPTSDLSLGRTADLILLVVPSHAMRGACRELAPYCQPSSLVVHATKGLEEGTHERMSAIILEEIPTLDRARLAVLSGPSHAEEVSRQLPTTLVVASASRKTAEFVQDALMNPSLRVYTNPDVIGTELGGALKNIIALGCGISDGLSFGDNAKAALMTRGLVEIARLGVRLGAAYSTFSGLTGVGDLIVTCTSRHSRNWNAGFLLGQGMSLGEALDRIGMVVEGVRTTRVALELAQRCVIELPIATAIGSVLFEGKRPKEAVTELMSRTRTHETEDYVQDTTASWEFA